MSRLVRLGALASLLVAAPLHARQGPNSDIPSIRTIASAPFPSAMVGAPSGKVVAWVQNAEGARSVWIASAPDYRARRVALFANDDGQDVSGLAFAADGRTLWFTRGGGPNRAGETPNPTSDPAGVEQAIWRVRLDAEGAAAERVAEGSRATPAPAGDALVFVRRGQVMRLATGPNAKGEATPLFRMRGSAAELRWSPDGTRLAFVSSRGTHAFVGVYDVTSGTMRWIAPSTDTDGSPVWSPDGSRLAFLREPYENRRMMFVPIRTAQPWSIQVADARTGATREVFRAAAGRGSAFWNMQAASQVMWTADDRIVFPWERDGYLHLYSVPVAGGQPVQLDRGTHEVEYVTMAADGRHLVFNSNQDDRDRRHLWRVPADGSRPAEPLTPGEGIEWAPVVLADGAIAHLRSDARQPAHAAIVTSDGARRALAPETMPASYPTTRLVVPTAVTLTPNDGVRSYGQLFLPPEGTAGGKRPAIIFLHGGSRRQMLLGWNYSSYYHNAYAFNEALALRGWVVLSLNYRSGIGYGRDFREALDYGATGGSEYRDVVAAARWLRARGDVDSTKVALWGGSYGGYLTAMGLSRNPELFAGGVDIHGVHDWNVGIRTFMPDYNPLEDPAASRLAFSSSPLSTVKGWKDPVLLIHGDDDRNVRFIETLSLIERLRKQGVHVEQLVFPDEIHGFLRHASWMTAFETSIDFLDRQVRGRGSEQPLRAAGRR